MGDTHLPRLVAGGLIIITLAAVASYTALSINHIDAAPVLALATAAVAGLVGFFSGLAIGKAQV